VITGKTASQYAVLNQWSYTYQTRMHLESD